MWWKKEIDDHTTLIVMRIAVAVMYIFVSCYLYFSSETNFGVVQGFKIVSNFCLMLAAVVLFPIVESIYAEENKFFVNQLSVAFSFFIVVIMQSSLQKVLTATPYNAKIYSYHDTYCYAFLKLWMLKQ